MAERDRPGRIRVDEIMPFRVSDAEPQDQIVPHRLVSLRDKLVRVDRFDPEGGVRGRHGGKVFVQMDRLRPRLGTGGEDRGEAEDGRADGGQLHIRAPFFPLLPERPDCVPPASERRSFI